MSLAEQLLASEEGSGPWSLLAPSNNRLVI
jgi:hypothetical protein